MTRHAVALFVAAVILTGSAAPALGQTAPQNGVRANRLVIRNAMVVSGNGTPASGPYDIVIEDHHIAQLVSLDPIALRTGANRPKGDAEIDATGKYVLPGIINAHAHLQDERGGIPQPYEYELKLWLSCGITTVREVGAAEPARNSAARPRPQSDGRGWNQDHRLRPRGARGGGGRSAQVESPHCPSRRSSGRKRVG